MEIALTDVYRAKWSDRVHEEWIVAVLRDRSDLTRKQLERTRDLMNAHERDALVTGFEPLIETLSLPDPDDRHVLAAAIKGRAEARGGSRPSTQMNFCNINFTSHSQCS